MVSVIQQASTRNSPEISIVTPAYREALNLPVMYEQLAALLDAHRVTWEWLIVDDHSPDDTYAVIQALALKDTRVRGIRLARNSGSHTAMGCGLRWVRGNAAIVMAADLQDPPETIPALIEQWRAGFHVVWAVRETRQGESATTLLAARIYYWIMRYFVGMKNIAATGADFMLLDQAVVRAFNEFRESTLSVLALITWLGFSQTSIRYDKQARLHGHSGWNLQRKIQLLIDSITSFSYAPIRVMSYAGISLSLVGFLYAAHVVVNAFSGSAVPGWTSLMVVVLVLGGMQMMMMGVLGIYLWRALDESRSRPRFIVESSTFNARTTR